MKKALVTGSQGFVGKYLCKELEDNGYTVIGLDLKSGNGVIQVDLLNKEKVSDIISEKKPDVIIHLAGQANVAKSWEIPQKTIEINLVSSINLLEAVRKNCPNCRVVMIGSSDQYGNLGQNGISVKEDMITKPQTPYAVSKKAQEEMVCIYAKVYNLKVCCTRSFNHGGESNFRSLLRMFWQTFLLYFSQVVKHSKKFRREAVVSPSSEITNICLGTGKVIKL